MQKLQWLLDSFSQLQSVNLNPCLKPPSVISEGPGVCLLRAQELVSICSSSSWRFCCIPALKEVDSSTGVRHANPVSWSFHSPPAPLPLCTDTSPIPWGDRSLDPEEAWLVFRLSKSIQKEQTPHHSLISFNSKLLPCKQTGGETPITTRVSSSLRERKQHGMSPVCIYLHTVPSMPQRASISCFLCVRHGCKPFLHTSSFTPHNPVRLVLRVVPSFYR